MISHHRLWIVLVYALAAALLAGCTVPAPTPTVGAPAQPTDTVVYGAPTAPSQASPAAPSTTSSPAGRATPVAPEAGPIAAGQLTILHTNDVRGWLDPCG